MKRAKALISIILSVVLLLAGCGQMADGTTATPQTSAQTGTEESAAVHTVTTSGTAKGFGGDVTVSITVDGGVITVCDIVGKDETREVGGAAIEKLSGMIVEANGKVDGISGATVTSNAVMTALQSALIDAGLAETVSIQMKPGTYTGAARGFSAQSEIIVHVTVNETEIVSMEIEENLTAVHPDTNTDCPHIAYSAFELLSERIIDAQSLAVDSITGATGSSSGIKNAVRDALTQALTAGGCDAAAIDAFYVPVEKKEKTVILEGYDVIVVGAGQAGVSALLAAQDANSEARIISIEKTAKWGGNEGDPLIYSDELSEQDIERLTEHYILNLEEHRYGEDRIWNDEAYREEHADEYTEVNVEALKAAFLNTGNAVTLMMEKGFTWRKTAGFTGGDNSVLASVREIDTDSIGQYCSYINVDAAFDNARAEFMENGGESLLETTGAELIYTDEAKSEIAGIKAVGDNGTTYMIYGKTVILATGGYGANVELMEEYTGEPWGYIASNNQGEGTRMALDAGGNPYNNDAYPMIHQRGPKVFLNVFDAQEYDASLYGTPGPGGETPQGMQLWSPNDITNALCFSEDAVYITDDGEFIDVNNLDAPASWSDFTSSPEMLPMFQGEGAGRFLGGEATLEYGARTYTILSAEQLAVYRENGMKKVNIGMNRGQYGVPANMPLGDWLDEAIEAGINLGFVFKADSLSQLASQLHVKTEQLETAVTAAEREHIGLESEYYIAIEGGTCAITTCGGTEVNANMQVVRTDGTVIENLFMVGCDSLGNLMATGCDYPLGGHAAMWAVSGGNIAGRVAVEVAGQTAE